MILSRPVQLFVFLNSLFLTFLIMAEVIGAKLFSFFGFTMTLGVIPFPVTFIVTDLLNEYYGRRGVRWTTIIGMCMVILSYFLILIGMSIPAIPDSPVTDEAFENVFFNSSMVILGSITAYLIGQLIDIQVFHVLRVRTKNRHIWLRATGSTIVSQLIDSFVVIFIAFGLYLPFQKLIDIAFTNFAYKMAIAVSITPLLYLAHYGIDRFLGEDAERMRNFAMREGKFYGRTIEPG